MRTYQKSGTVLFLSLGMIAALFSVPAADAAIEVSNAPLIPNHSLENVNAQGQPLHWKKDRFGDNDAIFTYPVPGYQSAKAARVRITGHRSGDAKWYFRHIPVKPGGVYKFRDFYKSDVISILTAEYKMANGTMKYRFLRELPPSNTWRKGVVNFVVPPGVVSLTIYHLIDSVGTLTVDNYSLTEGPRLPQGMVSLTFDDSLWSVYHNAIPLLNARGIKSTQYVLTSQPKGSSAHFGNKEILEMYRAGHEIGAHSRTHAHLTEIPLNRARQEMVGSKENLLRIGVNPVATFAYPFGEYNADILKIAEQNFRCARATHRGFNLATDYLYTLKVQNVTKNVDAAEIRSWIAEAAREKKWLILVFHQVNQGYSSKASYYSTTADVLESTLAHLQNNNVKVVPVAQGCNIVRKVRDDWSKTHPPTPPKTDGDRDDDDGWWFLLPPHFEHHDPPFFPDHGGIHIPTPFDLF